MQGDNLEKCMVKAPVLIEASHPILDALFFNEESHQFLVDADYQPQPSDDLCALVCSLFRLLHKSPRSIFCTDGTEDLDKIRSFWKQCGDCEGWANAFSRARDADYDGLKRELDKQFYLSQPRPFVAEGQRKLRATQEFQRKIEAGRYPLSPAKGKLLR